MKPREAQYGDEEYSADRYNDHCDDAVVSVEAIAVVQDVHEAHGEDGNHVGAEKDQEEEEVAVVAPPYAVVHPGTVVVERLYAAVAHAAVGTARRTVELACRAPLHAYCDAVDLHILVQWKPEVIILFVVQLVFWDDARVHKCGQGKVHKHKKRHKTLHNGDAVMIPSGQLWAGKHEKQRCRCDQQRPSTCRR